MRGVVACLVALAGCGGAPAVPPSFEPLVPEAGFVELSDDPGSVTSRLFYSFHPADEAPDEKPLALVFNGGPGYSTALLMTLGTGPLYLADAGAVATSNVASGASASAMLAPNPSSWTRFANLLYVDARLTGFSYDVFEDPDQQEFFSTYPAQRDADAFIEVLLTFLAAHPRIQSNPVLLVGESYGGARATIITHTLLHYADPDEDVPPAVVGRIQAQVDAALDARGRSLGPAEVAKQFGTQILIQGAVLGIEQPIGHAPAGFDDDEQDAPAGWTDALDAEVARAVTDPALLQQLWALDPRTVAELLPSSRVGAFRTGNDDGLDDGGLPSALGALRGQDAYFEIAGGRFAGQAYCSDAFYGDLAYTNLFFTHALLDAAIDSTLVATQASKLSSVSAAIAVEQPAAAERPGEVVFTLTNGKTRTARFPTYATSGHMVTVTQPAELAADVEAWLATLP